MTDQMFVFLCKDVRKYAFDYRRGELEDAEKRKFEEHVHACEACSDYVNRLEGMLDAAATQTVDHQLDRDAMFDRIVAAATDGEDDVEASTGLDKDNLFARITSELEAVGDEPEERESNDDRPAARVVELADRASAANDDDEAPVVSYNRGRIVAYVAAALAAGIAIGLLLPRLLDNDAPAPAPPEIAQNQKNLEREGDSSTELAVARVELQDLYEQPTPADVDDLTVFGEATSNWKLRTQGVRRQIQLESGTVLVEFVPRGERELEFVADQFTVRVTGTVFYASAEEGVVGVVTGSVEVATKDGQTVKLVDGQEWVVGSGLRQAPVETTDGATKLVDVEEHQLALEEARATARVEQPQAERAEPKRTAPRKVAPRPKMSKEVVETPTAELRRSADQALKDGRYEVAAQYYERMVDEFSDRDPANATLRLDLARIYMRHLDSPDRASVHLRRFVESRPKDPAAPSAKKELCRIVSETGQIEPMCDF